MRTREDQLGDIVRAAASLVRRDAGRLDALNVFPVADADTGTNLRRTFDAMVAGIDESGGADDVVGAIRRAALSGRGNSGLIIGQFVAGFAAPFVTDGVAPAVVAGAAAARRAVAAPVEGTVLSVADAVADALGDAAAASDADRRPPADAVALARLAERTAHEALARTPEQLDVLAAAGVVDSGGAGLVLFFEALRCVLADEPVVIGSCPTGAESAGLPGPPGHVVGHEIQFTVDADVADESRVRTLLASLGTDVVVAVSADLISAHVHVTDLDAALDRLHEALGRVGDSIDVRVEPLVERSAGEPPPDHGPHGAT